MSGKSSCQITRHFEALKPSRPRSKSRWKCKYCSKEITGSAEVLLEHFLPKCLTSSAPLNEEEKRRRWEGFDRVVEDARSRDMRRMKRHFTEAPTKQLPGKRCCQKWTCNYCGLAMTGAGFTLRNHFLSKCLMHNISDLALQEWEQRWEKHKEAVLDVKGVDTVEDLTKTDKVPQSRSDQPSSSSASEGVPPAGPEGSAELGTTSGNDPTAKEAAMSNEHSNFDEHSNSAGEPTGSPPRMSHAEPATDEVNGPPADEAATCIELSAGEENPAKPAVARGNDDPPIKDATTYMEHSARAGKPVGIPPKTKPADCAITNGNRPSAEEAPMCIEDSTPRGQPADNPLRTWPGAVGTGGCEPAERKFIKSSVTMSSRRSHAAPASSVIARCESAHRAVDYFLTAECLPFEILDSPPFKMLVDAVRRAPTSWTPCSSEFARDSRLRFQMERLRAELEQVRQQWASTGCMIELHRWTDEQGHPFRNVMVSSPNGCVFLNTVGMTGEERQPEAYKNILRDAIEFVGRGNVVGILFENARVFRSVGAVIAEEYPGIFSVGCTAHAICLMLHDICSFSSVHDAQEVAYLFMNHERVSELFSLHSGGRKLVLPTRTRPSSTFLMLHSQVMLREAMVKTVLEMGVSDDEHFQTVTARVCDESGYWSPVMQVLSVVEQLMGVLQFVDEGSPSLSKVYQKMDSVVHELWRNNLLALPFKQMVRDVIMRRWHRMMSPLHCAAQFLDPEFHTSAACEFEEVQKGFEKWLWSWCKQEQYGEVKQEVEMWLQQEGALGSQLAIVDAQELLPARWWEKYGKALKILQPQAVRLLGQASACSSERFRSLYRRIHSRQNNDLNPDQLSDLVFCRWNVHFFTAAESWSTEKATVPAQTKQRGKTPDSVLRFGLSAEDGCRGQKTLFPCQARLCGRVTESSGHKPCNKSSSAGKRTTSVVQNPCSLSSSGLNMTAAASCHSELGSKALCVAPPSDCCLERGNSMQIDSSTRHNELCTSAAEHETRSTRTEAPTRFGGQLARFRWSLVSLFRWAHPSAGGGAEAVEPAAPVQNEPAGEAAKTHTLLLANSYPDDHTMVRTGCMGMSHGEVEFCEMIEKSLVGRELMWEGCGGDITVAPLVNTRDEDVEDEMDDIQEDIDGGQEWLRTTAPGKHMHRLRKSEDPEKFSRKKGKRTMPGFMPQELRKKQRVHGAACRVE